MLQQFLAVKRALSMHCTTVGLNLGYCRAEPRSAEHPKLPERSLNPPNFTLLFHLLTSFGTSELIPFEGIPKPRYLPNSVCSRQSSSIFCPHILQILKATGFCGDWRAVIQSKSFPDTDQVLKATGIPGSGGCSLFKTVHCTILYL